jgi:hypothetical protein
MVLQQLEPIKPLYAMPLVLIKTAKICTLDGVQINLSHSSLLDLNTLFFVNVWS